MTARPPLTGPVEVVAGPYTGCQGVILDGYGRAGPHPYEAIRITRPGLLAVGVIERFDPKQLRPAPAEQQQEATQP